MPGKSKHGKGRRPHYRNRPRPQAGQQSTQTSVPAGTTQAATAPAATAPTAPKATAKAAVYTAATAAQYPFFTSELKRIGVITAIILIILIVLAFVIK